MGRATKSRSPARFLEVASLPLFPLELIWVVSWFVPSFKEETLSSFPSAAFNVFPLPIFQRLSQSRSSLSSLPPSLFLPRTLCGTSKVKDGLHLNLSLDRLLLGDRVLVQGGPRLLLAKGRRGTR